MTSPPATVRIWDLFVRVFHWTLAVGFFVAYFTEGEGDVELIHVWAGYLVGALILLRIVWGFVGPTHARFADFITGPGTGLRYLLALAAFRARRHLGHSPAGGWMALMLMAGVLATVAAGMANYGERGHGPLAPLFAGAAAMPLTVSAALVPEARADDDESSGPRTGRRRSAFKEIHELLATIVLILVLLHVAGVVLASVVHRENLVRAMITGRKRP